MSEVTDLIAALRNGSVSLEEVARRFRLRTWPARPARRPTSYLEQAAAAERDPEPTVPGSFEEVILAYGRGDLTDEEYSVLSSAAAEAIQAQRAAGVSRAADAP